MLVIEPSEEVFLAILAAAPSLRSYDGGDTGLLNAFFSDWYSSEPERRLPFAYNAQRTLFWFTQGRCPGYWESCRPLKVLYVALYRLSCSELVASGHSLQQQPEALGPPSLRIGRRGRPRVDLVAGVLR